IALEDSRLHGGWLEAWGEPGQGACFRLTLPRDRAVGFETSPLPLEDAEAVQPPALAEELTTDVAASPTSTGSSPAARFV
ncbi:hypothetical protein, partial [Salmonella enterica]|uniref:hypothetical protein n=1 Tax=Salmonella enterica TaxID=28901 RepID=UPI003CE8719E